jgi:His/Glu/Gln/Arg/opine family amino acid ABC transporter permease subunit
MEGLWEYRWLLVKGTGVTLALGLCGLGLAMLLGLAGAAAKISGPPVLRKLAEVYTTFVRSVPDLCMMLLLYFGGQSLMNMLGEATGLWDYVDLNPFVAGITTIGFIFGGYMTETFRGAYGSIPAGQFEAARAIGMRPGQVFCRISFPQLMGYALPSIGVNWMVLLKTTALVSVLGLQDLVYFGVSAGRSTREPFSFLLAIMAIYLLLTAVSDVLLRLLEARYTKGRRGAA